MGEYVSQPSNMYHVELASLIVKSPSDALQVVVSKHAIASFICLSVENVLALTGQFIYGISSILPPLAPVM